MSADPTRRFCEVDLLKALGILAVVLIHSLRSPWDPGISAGEVWLGHLTRFAVPGFFAASGFLYATTEPISGAVTRRRVTRVLIPYLIASLFVQLDQLVRGETPEIGAVLEALLLASSFGPYYFVLIFVIFVLCSPLLARVPPRYFPLLLVPLLGIQLLLETGLSPPMKLFWHLRNPFLWAGYFVLGWWARLGYARLRPLLSKHRRLLMPSLACAFLLVTTATILPLSRVAVGSLAWLGIVSALALGLVAGATRESLPAIVRTLSDSSYSVYLFHLWFLPLAQKYVSMERGVFEPGKLALIWSAGILGSLALVWLGRRILGERSRLLLGA